MKYLLIRADGVEIRVSSYKTKGEALSQMMKEFSENNVEKETNDIFFSLNSARYKNLLWRIVKI